MDAIVKRVNRVCQHYMSGNAPRLDEGTIEKRAAAHRVFGAALLLDAMSEPPTSLESDLVDAYVHYELTD